MRLILKTTAIIICILTGVLLINVIQPAAQSGFNSNGYDFNNALVNAADKGRVILITSLIASGNDPDIRGDNKVTALMRAAYRGHKEIAEMLIRAGANVNAVDDGGASALHFAARQGNEEIVGLLLTKNANPNLRDNEGWTPLMRAAASKKPQIMQKLIASGANINIENEIGETALSHAIQSNNVETVKLLLNKGADVNQENIFGTTPVEIAEWNRNKKIERLIKEKILVAQKSGKQASQIYQVARASQKLEPLKPHDLKKPIIKQEDSALPASTPSKKLPEIKEGKVAGATEIIKSTQDTQSKSAAVSNTNTRKEGLPKKPLSQQKQFSKRRIAIEPLQTGRYTDLRSGTKKPKEKTVKKEGAKASVKATLQKTDNTKDKQSLSAKYKEIKNLPWLFKTEDKKLEVVAKIPEQSDNESGTKPATKKAQPKQVARNNKNSAAIEITVQEEGHDKNMIFFITPKAKPDLLNKQAEAPVKLDKKIKLTEEKAKDLSQQIQQVKAPLKTPDKVPASLKYSKDREALQKAGKLGKVNKKGKPEVKVAEAIRVPLSENFTKTKSKKAVAVKEERKPFLSLDHGNEFFKPSSGEASKGIWLQVSGFSSEKLALQTYYLIANQNHYNFRIRAIQPVGSADKNKIIRIGVFEDNDDKAAKVCQALKNSVENLKCSLVFDSGISSRHNSARNSDIHPIVGYKKNSASHTMEYQDGNDNPYLLQNKEIFWLHLGSFDSLTEAEQKWQTLNVKHHNTLANFNRTIAFPQSGSNKKPIYKLRAGPIYDKQSAQKECKKLATKFISCFVVND